MSIKHDHTLNPVTALGFYSTHAGGQFILAGEGCHLKIFEATTSILLLQCKIFEGQAIHGITIHQNGALDGELEVAIWGGSFLTAFSHRDFTGLLACTSGPFEQSNRSEYQIDSYCQYQSSGIVSDWILDVAISPHKVDECVLVTAHNTVLRAKIEKDSRVISLEILHSPSRSILYSAQLVWECENTILVAAGTVFGEIIVWKCSTGSISSRSRVLHTFTGHEGSIFGVNISPVVTDGDGNSTRLLASCSDDRTIRIWELDLGEEVDGNLSEGLAARETGFGGNGGETSSKCLAMAMGHASRIWSVQTLVKNSDIIVLSFGEDATTQHWALEDWGYSPSTEGAGHKSQNKQAKLTHLNTYAFNSGKHIWSSAIRRSESAMVTAGGADGKISMYEINYSSSVQQSATQSRSWDLEDILTPLRSNHSINMSQQQLPSSEPPTQPADSAAANPSLNLNDQKGLDRSLAKKTKPKKLPKDAFNKYAFVSEDHVLVTTVFGRVLLGEIGACIKWTEVNMRERDDLRSYSIVRGIPAIGVAFLGSANGNLFIYRAREIQEFGKVSSKVADMFTLYDSGENVALLVTTLAGRFATLFRSSHDLSMGCESFKPNQRLREVQYCLPDKFIITSAGKTNDLLILGSRNGSLAIYDPEKCDGPICIWTPDSMGDAITSIVKLSNPKNDSIHHFLTTSRDGTYSIFSLADSKVRLVHQGTPPFGPMIEAAWFSHSDLIIYGFKSKNFILWNESKQYEISSVECGGAHRSYAYSPVAGSGGAGYFIYTKASKLHLRSRTKPSHQIIKPGGHGREIKTSAVSPDGLIATGAEDTTIRIWRYQDGNWPLDKQFDCLAVVQKHTTGIQHLKWHCSNYLFSSGGNEEFFIWAVELIPGFGIGVTCEATCPDQSEERDLRIMSFDVSSLPVSEDCLEGFLISLAYSDSTIRCYTYSKTQGYSLVATGRYTLACLMQLRHLQIRRNSLFFLTAGTDGYLTLWRTTLPDPSSNVGIQLESSQFTILSSHRLHQSSVKSLDIAVNDSQIVVATGGDDNALGVTIYEAEGLQREPPKSTILRSAHAAAITGISFMPRSPIKGGEELRIVTSSNDQRVKEWVLSLNRSDQMNDSALRKLGDVFTSVADVGDVTTLMNSTQESKKVLVVGNGMEVYEVSL